MRLVFTSRTRPHAECIKVDWPPNDKDLTWISLFYVPTEEDKRKSWSTGEAELRAIFAEFSEPCMPPESYTYAVLATPYSHEYVKLCEDIRKSGLPFALEEEYGPKQRILRSWFRKKRAWYLHVAKVDSRNVRDWYERFWGWAYTPYVFAASSKPLENWQSELLHFHDIVLKKAFFDKIDCYVRNHFDRGVEVIGLDVDVAHLESIAKDLSRKLELPLEIQQTGKPF